MPKSRPIQEVNEELRQIKEKAEAELDFDPKPFASLLNNKEELNEAFTAVGDAIAISFAQDIMRDHSAELMFNPYMSLEAAIVERAKEKMGNIQLFKHRWKICERWIRRARGDLGYTLGRTLDMLPDALRAELDGEPFDPKKIELQEITSLK